MLKSQLYDLQFFNTVLSIEYWHRVSPSLTVCHKRVFTGSKKLNFRFFTPYIATFGFVADTPTTTIGKIDGVLVLMKAGASICKNSAGSEQAAGSTRYKRGEVSLLWQHGGDLYLGNKMMCRRTEVCCWHILEENSHVMKIAFAYYTPIYINIAAEIHFLLILKYVPFWSDGLQGHQKTNQSCFRS